MPRQQQQSIYDIFDGKQFQDNISRRLVVESILNLDLDENQLEGTLNPQQIQLLKDHREKKNNQAMAAKSKSAGRSTIDAIKSKGKRAKDVKGDIIEEEAEEDYIDADQIEQGKRFRSFTYYQPPKFKLLGYSKYNKPIFKISDVFLTSDPVMQSIIDKQFNEIIYGRSAGAHKLQTGQLSKKYEKQYNFQEIVETWQKKQYQDVFISNNKKNKLDQSELEEIVVNRGDHKDNYWIYKTGDRNGCSWGDMYKRNTQQKIQNKQEKLNYILTNPKFKENMYKIINRMRLQYTNIEQFQDEDDEEDNNLAQRNRQEVIGDMDSRENKENQQKDGNQMINDDNNNDKMEEDVGSKKDQLEDIDNDQAEEEEQDEEEEEPEGQQDNDCIEEKPQEEEQSSKNYEKYEQIFKEQRKKEEKQKNIKQTSKAVEPQQNNVMILDDMNSVDLIPPKPQQQGNKDAVRLWGQIKEPNSNKIRGSGKNNRLKYELQQQQIVKETKNNKNQAKNKKSNKIFQHRNKIIIDEEKSLVEQIVKEYSVINKNIMQESYKGQQSINQYNRIQFHLQNPNFFLTKLHSALQKKSEHFENFIQGVPQNFNNNNQHLLSLNRNLSNPSAINRSMISGSLNTGNQGTFRQNNAQQNYMMGNNVIDEDHETIQQKILKEMNHHSRKPITHSEIATKLLFIKFSTDVEQFGMYHRHQFKYQVYFGAANKNKVKIQLLRHNKPLKNKMSELNINIEKLDSNKKFMKAESLSLASQDLKQFIIIEYIEENPLLMSDIGMCERMTLQINNQQMLHKINNDIINSRDLQQLEEGRDKPRANLINSEKKMEVWRKNIKQHFGDNGKVYLWEPKRESKTIGNPEGLGVAVMESNLSNIPIVKQNVRKTDFLLVREGNKWVLRKIDAIYTSGQVQPKQVVYTPDNRHYQSFLQNYQRDFIKKYALSPPDHRILIEDIKRFFPNTPQTSAESRLRKILKNKMKATTKDNKHYTIPMQQGEITYLIKPEDYCLYQRMQKSLHELAEVGISQMKNMEKMKSILRKYFRKDPDNLTNFAIARMIRDQLQLTSWYLTQSFSKFIDKKARIQMTGHADPTKGHGGYSYIKKPQKERTDKDQAQKKEEKQKLSGTQFDLRKLRAENSIQFLLQKGYTRQEVENKTRWQLVSYIKKQKNTQYARKQRQTKEEKQENQRRQRSKLFNMLLRSLKLEDDSEGMTEGAALIEPYQYDYSPYLDLQYYMERESISWKNCKQNYDRNKNEGDGGDDEDDDDDS